jgi:hydroxypyruvate reductase
VEILENKPRILLLHRHLEGLVPILAHHFTVLFAWVPEHLEKSFDVRALVVAGEVPLDRDLVMALPSLGLIACASTGYDGIDRDWVRSRGLLLTSARMVNDQDVADHAIGCMIMHYRGLQTGDRLVRNGKWADAPSIVNRSLRSVRVGIVGMGEIGRSVAQKATALGMAVRWWGPNPKEVAWERASSLLELAATSDSLVVTARSDATNGGLISSKVIDVLGRTGQLVNVARGALVDEDAVISALKAGRLAAAALDVFREEPTSGERWQDVSRVLLTPHIAGRTQEALVRIGEQLRANLLAFFGDKPLLTPV